MNAKPLIALALSLLAAPLVGRDLSSEFLHPPASARPWVYWFWNNGNVTKAGITADLEAMKRAGVGGVIIMDVVERFAPPPGTADFMGAEWQELFQFAVREARRLGLEINMTNGPGWCGSSGPWITPELSMQMLVSTNLAVEGPSHFSAPMPKPEVASHRSHDGFNSTVAFGEFYRDIAVIAFPKPASGIVAPDSVVNLTEKLGADGKLNWEVPAGQWIVERIGHTTTGSSTRPPVKGGNGLECDKLSAEAMDVHFKNMMGKLIAEAGSAAGPTLSATHIDSWEVGTQNWTPKFREEFQKRRGYDPIPYLPDVEGLSAGLRVSIGDEARATRFRWDFETTIAELLAEKYVGHLATLAHEHGLRLTLEGYNLPFGDEGIYTQGADEPMSEFWATGGNENEAKARQMASVAHIMGEKIVGAEAFTSGDNEQWKFTPATIKSLGDYEFSQGINRFVIHRYAHQPYLDRFPGATMGPWGLHYERTQTWWEMSTAWHEYLSRCQFMLRQGAFVADLCCLRPQLPNQTYFTPTPSVPPGYKYDECTADALIARMNVKDGRLVLPDGMSYKLLVLPGKTTWMTPALVHKIKQLVSDGATIFGPRPSASPSLQDYPRCDEEVANVAGEVWGDCDGKAVTEHAYGKGRVICGQKLEDLLRTLQTPPDFAANVKLNWIHRRVGDSEVYFVASEASSAVEARCEFRVKNMRPELWNPEIGEISPLAVYEPTISGIAVPLRLEPSGSCFVVFRPLAKPFDSVTSFTRDGEPAIPLARAQSIVIQKASYGVPGDAARTRDVKEKLQAIVNGGDISFQVAKLAEGDDPAYGIVKTFEAEYTVDGKPSSIKGRDPETVTLGAGVLTPAPLAELRCDARGKLEIVASAPGHYEAVSASGKAHQATVESVPGPFEIGGPWEVSFPPKWGAPEKISLEHLISLSDSTNSGVRYFSGTATYEKTFDWTPPAGARNQKPEEWLDLGDVQVMARVTLNGKDLGILWKRPFRVNISGALRPGPNKLEVRVADLWPNRMIGDAGLPKAERFTWSSYEPFTKDTPLPPSGLLGPVTIQSAVKISMASD